MTINELTGRELDAAIAQCLGWRPAVESCPKYSTDIAAAFQLQAELERRRLDEKFAVELRNQMDLDLFDRDERGDGGLYVCGVDDRALFSLINATAEQRASAALKVLRMQTDGAG